MTLYPGDPAQGLNNITIGGPANLRVGVGFKALFSSPVAAIRFYLMTQSAGYAAGTDGRNRYEIWSDLNGKPNAPIATGYLIEDPEYPMWVNNGGFPLIGFPSFPVLKKGTWYHFVMTNTDAQPTVNWTSFDAMMAKPKVPGQAGVNPDPNSFVEYAENGVWVKYKSTSAPVGAEMVAEPWGVFYADGNSQGNGGYQLAPDKSTMCGSNYGFGQFCQPPA